MYKALTAVPSEVAEEKKDMIINALGKKLGGELLSEIADKKEHVIEVITTERTDRDFTEIKMEVEVKPYRPIIELFRKRGHWEDEYGNRLHWGQGDGYCSACGAFYRELTWYCGSCGAEMDMEEQNE